MSDVADGPEISVIGSRRSDCRVGHAGDALGNDADDLILGHDADVMVRDERHRPATGRAPAVEDDRSGLGDRGGTAGDCAVDRVQLRRRQEVIFDHLHPLRTPLSGQRGRHHEPTQPKPRAGVVDRGGDVPNRDLGDGRVVVAHPERRSAARVRRLGVSSRRR